MRKEALQDLIQQPGRTGWACKGWGSSGCSDCEMVVFRILRKGNKANSRIMALDFRKTDFGLFREMLQRIPYGTVLERRRTQESWLIFKDPLHAQEQSIPMSRRSSKGSRRPS